jgi:fatty-acyl-CoA synthase
MSNWARQLIDRSSDRHILRVAVSPGAAEVWCQYTGSELITAATALADQRHLTKQTRVVILLLPHSPELFLLHLGLVLSGRVPAILPWPTARVDPEKYQRNLLHQLGRLPAHHLITLPRLAENLRPGLSYPVSGLEISSGNQFEKGFTDLFDAKSSASANLGFPELPAGTLFLQFSGGTTGAQKCVAVTEAMLEAQLSRLASVLLPSNTDGVVSWLPMYHDMGLIACLWFPLWAGIPSMHFAASDWLLRPEVLFQFLQEYGATLCWLPNFAFSYLAQRRRSMGASYSLAHVRAWINCSEPVRRNSMLEFAGAFSDFGVAQESLQASYAMAENVFAVTQTELGHAPRLLARSDVKHSTVRFRESGFELTDDQYVSSGRCLPDIRMRVVRLDGSECAEREAGELQLGTPCLFNGYWNSDGLNRDAFTGDGWYSTGDYGFLDQGECYVIGRIKDIIIVGGQNIFPEDLEVVAGRAPGVHPGRIVAFGINDDQLGTQSIAIVAEMAGDFDAEGSRTIEREIRNLIVASLSVAPRYVLVVPQRWIIKSTAGKISRSDTRARFLAEQICPYPAPAGS